MMVKTGINAVPTQPTVTAEEGGGKEDVETYMRKTKCCRLDEDSGIIVTKYDGYERF